MSAVMLGELLQGFLNFSHIFVLKAQLWATEYGALSRVEVLVGVWVHWAARLSLMSAKIDGPSKFKDIDETHACTRARTERDGMLNLFVVVGSMFSLHERCLFRLEKRGWVPSHISVKV